MFECGSRDDSFRDWDAIVAHQLKTPLCALDARLSETQPIDRDLLRQDIRRLTHLIDQLQRFARHRDSTPSCRRTVPPRRIVKDAARDLAPLAHQAGMEIVFRDWSRGGRVNVDPVLAGEAVRNLVENAIKYGGAGDTVNLVVGPGCQICVMDRGPGIGMARQRDLFRPGYRGTDRAPGNGLGLFLVREIMRRENGSVSIVRRRHGGTAATLRFEPADRARMPIDCVA